ncbi:MAG: thioredoxin family protein [Bacteroidetes bacterium]|nr:thioredoxin family protein [Bacteroidota bacterium]
MKKLTFTTFTLLLSLIFFLLSCSGPKRITTISKKIPPSEVAGAPARTVLLPPPPPKPGVRFVVNSKLMPLLDQAKEEEKLVFVDFYTNWCLPCKLMDEDVFPHKGTGDFFNDHFINYKVNAEMGHGVNLANIFEVKAYPTLLFLDINGKVLARKEGAVYHAELKEIAQRAIDKNKGQFLGSSQ